MSETPLSTETNTPTQPSHDAQAEAFDPSKDNPFIGRDFSDESQAARRVLDDTFIIPERPTTPRTQAEQPASEDRYAPKKPNSTAKRGIAATAAIAAGIVAGPTIVDHFDGPDFSEETTTYTVQPGDGLYDAANDVLGSEKVDIRDVVTHIESYPANIDALKDGLQPGESIVIPESVEP